MQTIDFFTPVVDDPYTFGQIAAANALSDVYAMGGRPVTCLNLVGFPVEQLPLTVLAEILKGGAERVAAARATLVGGHTIDDPEPKYGLAVTGLVHPQHLLANSTAQPSDLLILTKPLGIGIITTAMKRSKVPVELMEEAISVMVALNDVAAEVAMACNAHACTDITGFGLLGHLHEMALASGTTAEIWGAAVPVLAGVDALVAGGFVCGGSKANRRYAQQFATFTGVPDSMQTIFTDAITSGGLLMAVPPSSAPQALAKLHEKGVQAAAIIGQMTSGEPGMLSVRMHQ